MKKRTVMEHMGAALRRMAGVLVYACDDCGIVRVDEDACCVHCGADTTTVNAAWWNDSPLTGGGK